MVSHKYLLRFFLLFSSLVLALILAEVLFRLTIKEPIFPKDCFSLSNNFSIEHLPNTTCRFKTNEWDVNYKINSFGLRDDEVSLEKNKTVFRVLVIGDSYAEGWGVEKEQSFPEVLEQNLNKKLDKQVEVINTGVSGYSPVIYGLYLKEKGIKFEPDLLIVNLNLLDVSLDNLYYQNAIKGENQQVEAIGAQLATPFHLYLAHFDPNLKQNLQASYPWPIKYFKIFSWPIDAYYQKKAIKAVSPLNLTDNKWEITLDALDQITKNAKDNNTKIILVGLPNKYQLQKNTGSKLGKLTEFAIENNIVFLDLYNDFKAEKGEFFYKKDVHFTVDGHKLLAKKLTDHILENFDVK